MANPEHLEILKQGVEVWNQWWRENAQEVNIDLSNAVLDSAELNHAIFTFANLTGINLSNAQLQYAVFNLATLKDANLNSANLHGAGGYRANLKRANLRGARLNGALLKEANLTETDLEGAHFAEANLSQASLIGAKLADADFINARLFATRLWQADLRRAKLHGAFLYGVNLDGSDLTEAEMGFTTFSNCDIGDAIGLETVKHENPSSIGIDTIFHSGNKIPEIFIRGCGLPEDFITQIPALIASIAPIQFYKSFISYSSKDQKFADRLYADLQNKGVRCWLATEDLKIGAKIRTSIDEAIRLHDKLLLVLSKHSVASDWVEQEVETALERERKEKRLILFPIRLDDAVMKIEGGWPALIRNTRHIRDFRKWKDHDSYQKAFERLLRDLKAEDRQTAED